MKNSNSFQIVIFLVSSITATCFAQPQESYNKCIKLAEQFYQEKVKHILDTHGWLGKEEVGDRGSDALFLVVQHAGLPMQLQYLPLVRKM